MLPKSILGIDKAVHFSLLFGEKGRNITEECCCCRGDKEVCKSHSQVSLVERFRYPSRVEFWENAREVRHRPEFKSMSLAHFICDVGRVGFSERVKLVS
jgi:hypothetical protein